MKNRISLRWRLIFSAWLQAMAIGVLLVVVLQIHSQRNLRAQLDRTLETKADEVITVLGQLEQVLPIERFFRVETNYRFSQDAYFYQLSDGHGEQLARSDNLGDAHLPLPGAWQAASAGVKIALASQPHPLNPTERIRIRSEWVELEISGGQTQRIMIQTAASLGALDAAIGEALRFDLLVATGALAAVLFLLWLTTSRALRPVAAMTRKASEITARNLRERLPLAGTGDELDELAAVLNGMLDRLATSLRQTEAFSSDASHQLRTRLTRIRGELDLMLRSPEAESLRPTLAHVSEDLEQLSRLCSRLLLLARLDQHLGAGRPNGGQPINLDEPIDLNALMAELVEQLAPLAAENEVTLRHVEGPEVFIRGSRALIVEALLNLLDNAIRFSRVNGGTIEVSVGATGAEARASIADSGPGIPSEARERIFERFYRGPAVDAEAAGSGLGLAIVRRIAEVHGGRVEVEAAPDQSPGSVFHLVLPLERA